MLGVGIKFHINRRDQEHTGVDISATNQSLVTVVSCKSLLYNIDETVDGIK
jgi:hypothetical protein